MNIQETRQLGIEFERRIQTMIPQRELDKLDTETIYAFLNRYQDKYVTTLTVSLDQMQSGSAISARTERILSALLNTNVSQIPNDAEWPVTIILPSYICMYVSSTSTVSKSYSFKNQSDGAGVIPNKLVSLAELNRYVQNAYDNMRVLRNPIVAVSGKNMLTIVKDAYTEIDSITSTYYKKPQRFSILDNTVCELSNEAFEDLVTGAVDLYVQYVAGAEANKRRQEEANRQAQQNNKTDEQ